VVHAHDQQFVRVALVVDSEWPNAPTPHDSARPKARDWAIKFPVSQAFNAPGNFIVELRGGGRIVFVEVG